MKITLAFGEKYTVHHKLINCPLCNNTIKILLPIEQFYSLDNHCESCKARISVNEFGQPYSISVQLKEYVITCNFEMISINNFKSRSKTKWIKYKNNQHLKQLINTYKLFI